MSISQSNQSLTTHQELQAIFKAAESRHLTNQELDVYISLVPEYTSHAEAAREVASVEEAVVQAVVKDIFILYPYEKKHQLAFGKCIRDISYVSAYATQAMLMNDPQWFEDKLLIWLKTILQAFEFPEPTQKATNLFSKPADALHETGLSQKQRSVFATYSRLKHYYQEKLSPTAFDLMASYLQQAIDTLSSD
jgi:hypothetical protein